MHLYGPDRISSVGAEDGGVGAGHHAHGAERSDRRGTWRDERDMMKDDSKL